MSTERTPDRFLRNQARKQLEPLIDWLQTVRDQIPPGSLLHFSTADGEFVVEVCVSRLLVPLRVVAPKEEEPATMGIPIVPSKPEPAKKSANRKPAKIGSQHHRLLKHIPIGEENRLWSGQILEAAKRIKNTHGRKLITELVRAGLAQRHDDLRVYRLSPPVTT